MLTDRASCFREFLRLVNASEDDTDATEFDESANEGMYLSLQSGAEDAQQFLLDSGMGDWWLAVSSAITWTGSDPDRYWALPSDFLRFAGDTDQSPFRSSDGMQRWGRQVQILERWRRTGDFWYFGQSSSGTPRIYLTRSANPLSDMVADYYRTVGTLADDEDVDFPAMDRGLIPAFAALHAMEQSWFPGDDESRSRIQRNVARRKDMAWRRGRRTQAPRTVKVSGTYGDHWML